MTEDWSESAYFLAHSLLLQSSLNRLWVVLVSVPDRSISWLDNTGRIYLLLLVSVWPFLPIQWSFMSLQRTKIHHPQLAPFIHLFDLEKRCSLLLGRRGLPFYPRCSFCIYYTCPLHHVYGKDLSPSSVRSPWSPNSFRTTNSASQDIQLSETFIKV